MTALPHEYWTVDQYFTLESTSQERHEYLDGQIYAMSGGSPNHYRITRNINTSLHIQTRGGDCESFPSDTSIGVSSSVFFYADASVLCGGALFTKIHGISSLINPNILIEVLSPSTEKFDRSEKFRRYRQIESLQEYVLIAQDAPLVECFSRQPNGMWTVLFVEGLDKQITLQSVGCTLTLMDIYENVTFDSPDAEQAES